MKEFYCTKTAAECPARRARYFYGPCHLSGPEEEPQIPMNCWWDDRNIVVLVPKEADSRALEAEYREEADCFE